jgi:hypothetical protein
LIRVGRGIPFQSLIRARIDAERLREHPVVDDVVPGDPVAHGARIFDATRRTMPPPFRTPTR